MQSHFGKTSAALGLLMTMALTGCGGGGSDTSSTITGTTYATAGVLCNFSGSGNQNLAYNNAPNSGTSSPVNETLTFNYSWTCTGSTRTVSGNGVPNHDVTGGNFATKVSAQNISVSMSTSPIASTTITSVKLPGYALNSVKMDPATAGTCTNLGAWKRRPIRASPRIGNLTLAPTRTTHTFSPTANTTTTACPPT